jgi:hypothetical protein
MIFKNNVVWLTWLKWGGINLKDEWEKKIKKKKKLRNIPKFWLQYHWFHQENLDTMNPTTPVKIINDD